jgi:NodT family efflux transporter outer membrane factor (OMF) lipoprotein
LALSSINDSAGIDEALRVRATDLTAVLACVFLSACASARAPVVALPAAYEGPTPTSSGPSAEVLDRWWAAFEDPALTGLIEQALVNSPDARSAAASLREARATAQSALTAFLPQGNVVGRASRTNTEQLSGTVVNLPGFSTSGASDTRTVDFDVSWELDVFGRFLAARRAAKGDTAAARFNYEGTRASLAANVADTYFQARGLAIQLDDARESARIQRSLQGVAQKKADHGLGADTDVDRVAGDLAQADAQVAGLEAELQAARRALLVLVGRGVEPTANAPVTATVGRIPPVPATVPSELLARRPDIREAQARMAAAVGRQNLGVLAFFPTFTLTPGLGWSDTDQPGFRSRGQSWTVGGQVTQPILDIPRLLLELKAQNARTEQAAIAYEKTVQTAFGEAESSLVQLAADRRRTALLRDGAARAERAYEAARLRYAAGLDDLPTALSAEQSWRTTRSQYTAAQVQALRRAVQSYKALGGGWSADIASAKTTAG